MTSRNYDVILTVASAAAFKAGNNIIGSTSRTSGMIAAVDYAANKIKVKLNNLQQEFSSTEGVHSNTIMVTGNANGSLNTLSLPFQANTMSGNVQTATSTISAQAPSTFIAEKNAFTQNPVVRLYSIYYPGDWYPPNAAGNPTGAGAGYAWPNDFPIRLAEIVGDTADDVSYNVTYANTSFLTFPINLSGLEQGADGKINELSLTVFNADNIISALVEDPYLLGRANSNSVSAIVNGELVGGIDPQTVIGSPTYLQSVVDYYGKANASFDKTRADATGSGWTRLKADTRDLLGASIEIKTTFANFLDTWPEYSKVSAVSANTLTMLNSLPYRVGDILIDKVAGHCNATIQAINADNIIVNRKLVDSKSIIAQTSVINNMTAPTSTNTYIHNTGNSVFQYSGTDYSPSSLSFVRTKSLAEETILTGIFMTTDGTNLYTVGSATDNVRRYTLSVPYNISTTTYVSNLYVGALEGTPFGIALDPSGSNLYVVGTSADRVFKYTLSTPLDITTGVINSNLNVGTSVTGEGTPVSLYFKPDGSSLYLLGSSTRKIFQFNMSTGWDITTATLAGNTYIGGYDLTPRGVSFKSDGSNVLIGGQATDQIYSIPLDTAWNITTANTQASSIAVPLYILNPQADTASYMVDTYKIDQLEGLSESVATFGLVSWLQYFKIVTPKRKYYKNTCQWEYKGPECQYPGFGALAIPGTNLLSNTNPIAANNMAMIITPDATLNKTNDVCAKSLAACTVRNNYQHFGGFPAVGRTVPQM